MTDPQEQSEKGIHWLHEASLEHPEASIYQPPWGEVNGLVAGSKAAAEGEHSVELGLASNT